MKTIEQLELQLRALTPRAPSPRLRSRIFGRPAAEPAWGRSQARLAFASVVGLALIITVRQNPPAVTGDHAASQALMLAAMSNQTLAPYMARHDTHEWNQPASSYQATNFLPPVAKKTR